MKKLFVLPVAILSTTLFVETAVAQPGGTRVSTRVSYADLDLNSPAGRATLDERISGAARRVCGVRGPVAGYAEFRSQRACLREAMSGARSQSRIAIAQARSSGAVLAAR